MASEYLASGELATYGLPASVTSAQIQAASRAIDAMKQAPKGLVWAADAAGRPCYMTGAVAAMEWSLAAALAAGTNVTVAFDKAPPLAMLGRPVVLDRTVDNKVEAATIIALDGANVTFDKIAYAHDEGVSVEAGLQHQHRGQTAGRTERVYLAAFPVTSVFLPHTPVGGLISVRTRLAASSWGLADSYFAADTDQVAVDFLTPGWTPLDLTNVEIKDNIGQIFLPLDLKTEVDIHYVSGWRQEALPVQIKQACAQLIAVSMGEGAGNPEVLKDIKAAFNPRRFGI